MKTVKATKLLIFLSIISILLYVLYQYVYIPKLSFRDVGECVPVNFRKEEKSGSYYFLWETKSECIGYVKYGTKDNSLPYLALDQQGVVKLKEHSVKLSGVSKNDQYYFIIISNDTIYGDQGAPTLVTF